MSRRSRIHAATGDGRTRRAIPVALIVAMMLATMGGTALAQPPGNDDRANATVVGAIPFSDTVDTSEATPQASDPDCGISDPETNPSVWYSFTPSESRRLAVRTAGSDYDTSLLLAIPIGGGDLEIIDCNDDASDLTSLIVWQAVAGQEYLIMAGSCCGSPGGQLEIRIGAPPRDPTVRVHLAETGTISRLGAAVIHGWIRCTGAPAGAYVWARVRQDFGRTIVRGYAERRVACNGPWSLRARNESYRFVPGKVTVRVGSTVCNGFTCARDGDWAIVTLRRD